jgi:hypothetical protein
MGGMMANETCDGFETNLTATLCADIPSLGWRAGDAVRIRRLHNPEDCPTAYVVHSSLGNTLNNVALPLLDFPEKIMIGSQWPREATAEMAKKPFTFNRIRFGKR